MSDATTQHQRAVSSTIRPAGPADQVFISEMQYEALFVPPGEVPFPRSILDRPDILRYHAGFGALPGDVGVIAEDSAQRLVGAAWVRLVAGYGFVDALTPELGIAVVADARGNGVGSALLAELLAIVPRLSLSVDTRNRAMRLYERFGFRTVRIDGEHSAVMLSAGDSP
jgi:ribosomal protein S18 acetylase RimI-like enzyme